MRLRFTYGLPGLVLALTVTPAVPSVLLPADLADLTVEARTIVYGRVADVSPRWVSGRRRIERAVTLEALDVVKGAPARRLTIRVAGGRLGRYRSILVGAPVFRAGEEVVLFLGSHEGYGTYVLGLNQGVFRVSADRGTGRRMVTPPPPLRPARDLRVVRGDPARRPEPLATFLAHVRTVLDAAPAAQLW